MKWREEKIRNSQKTAVKSAIFSRKMMTKELTRLSLRKCPARPRFALSIHWKHSHATGALHEGAEHNTMHLCFYTIDSLEPSKNGRSTVRIPILVCFRCTYINGKLAFGMSSKEKRTNGMGRTCKRNSKCHHERIRPPQQKRSISLTHFFFFHIFFVFRLLLRFVHNTCVCCHCRDFPRRQYFILENNSERKNCGAATMPVTLFYWCWTSNWGRKEVASGGLLLKSRYMQNK